MPNCSSLATTAQVLYDRENAIFNFWCFCILHLENRKLKRQKSNQLFVLKNTENLHKNELFMKSCSRVLMMAHLRGVAVGDATRCNVTWLLHNRRLMAECILDRLEADWGWWLMADGHVLLSNCPSQTVLCFHFERTRSLQAGGEKQRIACCVPSAMGHTHLQLTSIVFSWRFSDCPQATLLSSISQRVAYRHLFACDIPISERHRIATKWLWD